MKHYVHDIKINGIPYPELTGVLTISEEGEGLFKSALLVLDVPGSGNYHTKSVAQQRIDDLVGFLNHYEKVSGKQMLVDIECKDQHMPWTSYKSLWVLKSIHKPTYETTFANAGKVHQSTLEDKIPKYDVKLSKEEIDLAIASLQRTAKQSFSEEKAQLAESLYKKLEEIKKNVC
jgi:hypothetical protein